MIKLIALGNRLMGDDAIALHVTKKLLPLLKGKDIEIRLGETDLYYCLLEINKDDFLILMDATSSDLPPGTVTTTPLDKIRVHSSNGTPHTLHLLDLLRLYKLPIRGVLLGIEVAQIQFSSSLSSVLQQQFKEISEKCYDYIISFLPNSTIE